MNDRRKVEEVSEAGNGLARGRTAAARQMKRLGKAMVQGGGVVSVLRLVIVVELCVLGVGVVRRLENSYERALEAARMELAVIEAQDLARERPQEGSAGIGAVDWEKTQQEASEESTDEAPGLRPRDVATILSDETGDVNLALALMAEGDEGGAVSAGAYEEQPASASEDDEELDALIRRGVTAMIAGDMRRCILSLEEASAVSPNHPALLYYYGLAYDKLLNPAKAREYYSKIFSMRDKAGKYFQRASRRLTYGMEQPSAMRGKLSFGPYHLQHTYDYEQGESVNILLPIMLAPGEEVRPDDIYITIQFFDMINGRKVDFSRVTPRLAWVNERPTWAEWEEDLKVSYAMSAADGADLSAAGDVKYYGFTAKLYYKGEPLDCISTPSSLILHEQRLNSRRRGMNASGLLPDDGLSPLMEEAIPYSQEYDQSTEMLP